MPPTSRASSLPVYFLASMTKTPDGPTTRWSMLARLPGMRRSCSTSMPRTPLSTSPTSRSPSAPTLQLAVVCDSGVIFGLAVSAAARRPITGRAALASWRHRASAATICCFLASSRADLRLYMFWADTPAVSASAGGAGVTRGRSSWSEPVVSLRSPPDGGCAPMWVARQSLTKRSNMSRRMAWSIVTRPVSRFTRPILDPSGAVTYSMSLP